MFIKQVSFSVSCLAGICALLYLTACSEPPAQEPPPKLVKAIQLGDVGQLAHRALPGRAEAAQEAILSFRVSGQMVKRPVKVGDKVKEGAVLAELDSADLKNALKVAQGGLAKAQAALEDTAADYRRAISVQQEDAGAISQQSVDQAKAAKGVMQASVSSAQSAVDLARDRFSYAVLKAPFAGEIVAVHVEAFETVVAKQPIVKLLNRDAIEFKIDVPETLIGYASYVESAHVRFDVQPDIKIEAAIKEIGREASRGTRTYPITLILKQTDKFDILPGMAGKAHIKTRPPKGDVETGMQIPAAALFSSGDKSQSYVWVIVNKKLEKRQVTVGKLSDFGVRILKGLKKGEWIVVAGASSLSEGQAVRVLNPTKTTDAS